VYAADWGGPFDQKNAGGETLRHEVRTTHRILKLSMLKLRPWSPAALLVALTVVAAAVALRELLDHLGATVYFATFLPAVLLASLLAGVPAGACAALLAIPIVWWGFMPPVFEFSPLTLADYNNFTLFLLGSTLLIWFAQLCREALVALQRLESTEEY
jgi:K+-sensing histidine kinase KdpD